VLENSLDLEKSAARLSGVFWRKSLAETFPEAEMFPLQPESKLARIQNLSGSPAFLLKNF